VNSPLSYSSVDTASRLFRTRGIENVAVADLMKESGFTHGGFYNHFKSKEELVHQVSDWGSGVAIKMGRRQGATKEHI
jgi:AcrR family transcriptional regulator